jgi:uncharacterized protein (TIGR02147 family)
MTEIYLKDPRDYLNFELELRKARRPAYSMRAFARDLSVSPSSLNDFLKARVGMSEARIDAIAQILKWSDERREHFRDLILARFDRDPGVRQSAQMRARSRLKDGAYKFSLEAFKVISDWYHLAILELCALKDGLDAATMAHELNLEPGTVKSAVNRLLKLQFLKKTETGLKPEDDTSHFGDMGSSEAIKKFHSQILEMAQRALFTNSGPRHDSQSLVYSVAQKDLAKMNGEIRKSVLNIVNRYAQQPNSDCIQVLTLQIFPVWPSSPKENI